MRRRGTIGAIVCLAAAWLGGAAAAAPCRTSGPYDKWLAEFEREALAKGVSQQSIAAAAPYLTYDQRIVNIDRGQRVFTQTFLEFSDRMAAAYRIQRGAALIKTYASVIAKIDRQIGVPSARDRVVLGARKRFWRQYGQLPHAQRARFACL